MEKVEKLIKDPADQSQNLTECSLSEGLHSQKFHEQPSTTFWVILYNVYKPYFSHVKEKNWSCIQLQILVQIHQ